MLVIQHEVILPMVLHKNLVDNIPSPSKHEEEEKEIKIEAE